MLPAFLEFLGDAVLVAHNAPYDVGFLKAACGLHDYAWPGSAVVDTARLARVALHRDEVRNCKLGTLAAHFRTSVTPNHRAFDDASATADVLHGLIERAGDLGVSTLEDLQAFASRVSAAQRTKRHLADGLPDAPGVYVFQDAQGTPLYVGTSRSIRTRVRSYFTASEQRRRMAEMVRIAERVVPIVCATVLEARVRELRLIAEHKPRYNQRSRRPESQIWLKLTVEPAPRLAQVRAVADDAQRRRPLPRAVRLAARRRGRRRGPPAGAPGAHLHLPHRPSAPAAGARMRTGRARPLPGPVLLRRRPRGLRRPRSAGCATRCPATSAPPSTAVDRADGPARRRGAVRGGGPLARATRAPRRRQPAHPPAVHAGRRAGARGRPADRRSRLGHPPDAVRAPRRRPPTRHRASTRGPSSRP